MASQMGTLSSFIYNVEYKVPIKCSAFSLCSMKFSVDMEPSVTKDSTALIVLTIKNVAAMISFRVLNNKGVSDPLYMNSSAPCHASASIF